MCFMSGGGTTRSDAPAAAATPAAVANQIAPAAAAPASVAAGVGGVGGRKRRFNSYEGYDTDMVGARLASTQKANNDNASTGALKKMMGA